MACWRIKAAISRKRVKIEEKLLWTAYRNSDFKFGGYIYKANPNKSALKILEKIERGRIQGLPKYFGYPLLSQERVKPRTSNFVGTFI